ncbi:hypothetical protein LZC95_14865 [Pendulispora brunnea]|uniref:Hyaluronan/mRNA-binding protein domain-containing protein n=1 Tax=Pendulispora brunnea TaxID=2905690 RepID=A0ABZ2KHR4_9BACT
MENPKHVKSDLKDVRPDEMANTGGKNRWGEQGRQGERSDHVTKSVPEGDNEQRGGRERSERRGGDAVGPARGSPRH